MQFSTILACKFIKYEWIYNRHKIVFKELSLVFQLMLARFSHEKPYVARTPAAIADAEMFINQHKLSVKIDKATNNNYEDNLRCLVLMSDDLYQGDFY